MKLSYDEVSPLTKHKSVLVEQDENGNDLKICMESGYSTCDEWIFGSDQCRQFDANCPAIVRETAFVDYETWQVWYRLTIVRGNVILYPDIYDGDCIWKVGTFRNLEDGEVADPSKLTQVVGDVVKIVDDEHSAIFEDGQFSDAFDLFNQKSMGNE